MGIFSSIKNAIWGEAKAQKPEASTPAPEPTVEAPKAPDMPDVQIDVEQLLEDKARLSGQKLNWRSSIVDLMKLVGIDPSLSNRKELAQELGYTGALDGSAEMNIWLHKAVMKALAESGGKVPAEMLD